MRKKWLIIISGFIVVVLIIAVFIFFSPKGYDCAILPEQMDVDIAETSYGYEVLIIDEGDFTNDSIGWPGNAISTDAELKWQIWNADEIKEIESGYISPDSFIVKFNDSNSNQIIDAGDKFQITNPAHSYGKYYFIVSFENARITVIHDRIPQ